MSRAEKGKERLTVAELSIVGGRTDTLPLLSKLKVRVGLNSQMEGDVPR